MTTPRKTPKKKATAKVPRGTKEMPATQGMLMAVRDELKHEIAASEKRTYARIEEVRGELLGEIAASEKRTNARIDELSARVDKLDANVQELRVSVARLEAAVEKLHAVAMRGLALNEQQDARNAIVLEAVTGMIDRQNRIEKRQDEQEELLRLVIRGLRAPGA